VTLRPSPAVRRALGWLAAAVVIVVVAVGCATSDAPAGVGVVERVVDGDTLVVRIDGESERVRLLGIDTPETVHPQRPVECFGPEASARLKHLAPEGSQLQLERDTELRDRFGRLLAYAYAPDGTFINLSMVADGYATTLHISPNGAYRQQLSAAEQQARQQGKGLWSACN